MQAIFTSNTRIFGLDLVRATAIICVLISHLYYVLNDYYPFLMMISGVFGYFGVELFFVLSGFLIGTILLDSFVNQAFSFSAVVNFLKRRWFRTLPAYYLVLVLNIIIAFWFQYDYNNVLKYFFFIQNFSYYDIGIFKESWSLSVEEWTYLSIPVLLLGIAQFFKTSRKKMFLALILLLIFMFHTIRYISYIQNPIKDLEIWNVTIKSVVIYRIDAILWGFIVAWCYKYYAVWLKKLSIYFFIIAVHLFLAQFLVLNVLGFTIVSSPVYFNVFYFTLTSVTITMLLPVFVFWTKTIKWLQLPVTFISKISYSMYLLHYSIISVLLKYSFSYFNVTLSSVFITVLYFSITILLSYFLYTFFEKPIMNLRDK
ncbi:acyltransferase family protein [Flavobacterium sp.]|uniref:acyltransferase family protein n=1 Tax=Flavobacterium sp. TaxID=239 RepID=UPI0035287D5E